MNIDGLRLALTFGCFYDAEREIVELQVSGSFHRTDNADDSNKISN